MVEALRRMGVRLEPYFLRARISRADHSQLAARSSLTSNAPASMTAHHLFVLKKATGFFAATPNFKGIARLLVLGVTPTYLGASIERFHRVERFTNAIPTKVLRIGIG